MKKEVEWEDWEWTNGKYGKIDSIEIEEDEDERRKSCENL